MGKDKKEKKDKTVAKADDADTRVSKKEKKSKSKSKPGAAEALLDALDKQDTTVVTIRPAPTITIPAELVPFAQPLANEKQTKKVLKVVKKGAKAKCLKRGVKEVVKALRKSPAGSSGAGIVVLAADISPMDVISHIPILCEDHGVSYIFVQSRAELGAAAATKRPTSVVMIVPGRAVGKKSKKGDKAEDSEVDSGFREAYDEAIAMIEKAMRDVPH